MRTEGQPRLIQRIIHPFKRRGEATVRQQPQREPQREPLPHYMDDPRLDQAAKDRIKAFHENVGRSMKEFWDSQPKIPIYEEIDGKMMTFLEGWNWFREKKERQRQEAIARGEFPDISRPAPLVPEKLAFDETVPLTSRQRSERDFPIVLALREQLINEVKNAELDKIAERVKTTMWTGRDSAITSAGYMKTAIKEDGTVLSRTRVGFSLFYPHDEPKVWLFMGIGYVGKGERDKIIPEARGVVSDEDLEKGAKAYFIQRTSYRGTILEKREMEIIPFAYAEAQRTFYEHLSDSAAPREVKPQRHHQQRSFRRNHPLAAAA